MTQRAVIIGIERDCVMRPPNTVQCDIEGCGAEIYVERLGRGHARAQAAEKGWRFEWGKDICPKHGDL